MKIKFLNYNDYAALESCVLLSAIRYERVKCNNVELNVLDHRIKYLKKLIK